MAKGDSGTFTEAILSPVFPTSSDTVHGTDAGEQARQTGPYEPQGDTGSGADASVQIALQSSDTWSGLDQESVALGLTIFVADSDFAYCWDHPPGKLDTESGSFDDEGSAVLLNPYTYALPAQPGHTWRGHFQRRIPSAQVQFFTLSSSDTGNFHDGK